MKSIISRANRRGFLLASVMLMAHAITPVAAEEAAFPSRPITVVVPGPAGGVADIVARLLGQEMSKSLGQPIIVDNKPGASQIIGVQAVTRAAADGYTILMGPSTSIVLNPQVNEVPYDPEKDLTPIGLLGRAETLVVSSPQTGFRNLDDLIRAARAKPGQLRFGSAGQGTVYHLGMEYLQSLTGVKMDHIPYKGSVPAEIAVISGEVDAIVTNTSSILPHLQSGRAVPLAIISRGVSRNLPEVAAAEKAVPGLVLDTWLAFYAPAGTPDSVVRKLNQATTAALHEPDTADAIRAKGFEPEPGTVEDLLRYQSQEREVWRKVVEAARASGGL